MLFIFTCQDYLCVPSNGRVHLCKSQHCLPEDLRQYWVEAFIYFENNLHGILFFILDHLVNVLNYLKDWKKLSHKLYRVAMIPSTSDCMVTHHDLPLCCRLFQCQIQFLKWMIHYKFRFLHYKQMVLHR